MVLFRALGWLLLTMAVGAVVYDGLVWWSEGVLRLLPLGELWSRLDVDSMNRAQSAVQRHLSFELFERLFSFFTGLADGEPLAVQLTEKGTAYLRRQGGADNGVARPHRRPAFRND